jgi:hypothetical protein
VYHDLYISQFRREAQPNALPQFAFAVK